jgi:gliding motility-associated-like protein
MKRSVFHIVFVLSLFFTNSVDLLSQNLFHQDIFYGGVTAGGFSTGQGAGSGSLNLYIEPGSTIRKAYMFSYRQGYSPSVPITINGTPYVFDTLNCIMTANHTSPLVNPIKLYFKDFTSELNGSITANFNINIPDQFGLPIGWGWWSVFVYIEYENPLLPKVATSLWVNDKDYVGNESYYMNGLNPIDTGYPVTLSLMIDRGCNNTNDGTIVNVNSNPLGIIGIPDAVNNLWPCAGSKGHFYYQNNALFGLDDDTPDNIMNGSDALADISLFLSNGATTYSTNLMMNNPNPILSDQNVDLLFINAYSTPCDTFSTTIIADTVICQGENIQLYASGGTNYTWLPQAGLSNPNSSNPIASPDSTTLYIVQIESAPGCSRTEKVLVKVNENPTINNLTITSSICGNNDGIISINATGNNPLQYSIGSGFQMGNSFSNLSTGNYTISIFDNNTCFIDTLVFVPETNPVNSFFTTNPQSGTEPLFVDLSNLSTDANNYIWSVDNTIFSFGLNTNYTFTNSGNYTVSLIAFNSIPQCADTFSLQIIVYDSLMFQIPNVFTPNNDGINDVFSISVDGAKEVNISILNRLGNTIQTYSNKTITNPSTLVIWNGEFKGTSVTEGVYFYMIEFTDLQDNTYNFQGYIHVER